MLTEQFTTALKHIAIALKDVDWVLIGSANHALQGMNTDVHDIDIIVREQDLERVRKRFAQATTITLSIDENKKFDVTIHDVPVEIITNTKESIDTTIQHASTQTVIGENHPIMCRSVQEEIIFYKKIGRSKKVEALEQFIQEKQ